MFWLKLLVIYPFTAFVLYMISGKTMATMMLCILMLGLMKLSVFLLREITNQ